MNTDLLAEPARRYYFEYVANVYGDSWIRAGLKQQQTLTNYYCEHPERREEISRQMQEYLAQPGNRAFVESDCKAKPVLCVETGEWFPSQYAAERATGYSGIHKVCHGVQRTCGGYHWKYAEERDVV